MSGARLLLSSPRDIIPQDVLRYRLRIQLRQGCATPDTVLLESAGDAVCPRPSGWPTDRSPKTVPQRDPKQLAARHLVQKMLEEAAGVPVG